MTNRVIAEISTMHLCKVLQFSQIVREIKMKKRQIVIEMLSILCASLLVERLIRKMIGKIDKYKAEKNIIGTSIKGDDYEKKDLQINSFD